MLATLKMSWGVKPDEIEPAISFNAVGKHPR